MRPWDAENTLADDSPNFDAMPLGRQEIRNVVMCYPVIFNNVRLTGHGMFYQFRRNSNSRNMLHTDFQ